MGKHWKINGSATSILSDCDWLCFDNILTTEKLTEYRIREGSDLALLPKIPLLFRTS